MADWLTGLLAMAAPLIIMIPYILCSHRRLRGAVFSCLQKSTSRKNSQPTVCIQPLTNQQAQTPQKKKIGRNKQRAVSESSIPPTHPAYLVTPTREISHLCVPSAYRRVFDCDMYKFLLQKTIFPLISCTICFCGFCVSTRVRSALIATHSISSKVEGFISELCGGHHF